MPRSFAPRRLLSLPISAALCVALGSPIEASAQPLPPPAPSPAASPSPDATPAPAPAPTAATSGASEACGNDQVKQPAADACSSTPADQRLCECGQQLWNLEPLLFSKAADITHERCLEFTPDNKQHWCAFYASKAINYAALKANASSSASSPSKTGPDGPLQPAVAAQASPLPDKAGGIQGGSTATAAAPSIEPVQFASETASAGYTRSGGQLLVSANINPLGGLARTDPQNAYFLMRLFDVGIQLPLNLQGLLGNVGAAPPTVASPWNVVQNVGLRLRVNFLAGAGGPSKDLLASLKKYNRPFEEQAKDLEKAFEDPTVALLDVDQLIDAITKRAGGALVAATTTLAADLAAKNHHNVYLGLDARLDVGDPTFAMSNAAIGVAPLVALAGGYSYEGDRGRFGVRGRLGWHRFHPLEVNTSDVNSLDWAAAIAFGWSASFYIPDIGRAQGIDVNLGFEGRTSSQGDNTPVSELGVTNTISLRGNLNVPLTTGSSVGLGLAMPIRGNGPAMITLSGNLAQLLGVPVEVPLH